VFGRDVAFTASCKVKMISSDSLSNSSGVFKLIFR
jgi:hypothetical protein